MGWGLLDIGRETGYSIGMVQKFTERQIEVSIAIREVVKTPDGESWGAFTDVMRAMAKMIEGAESLVRPKEMQKRFSLAWETYAGMWKEEHNRIVRDCLGGQKEFDRVSNHPNGKAAFGRILNRVKEVHGTITAGMEIDIQVDDILIDELGETA